MTIRVAISGSMHRRLFTVKNLRELVQESVDTTNEVCGSSEQMKSISNSAMMASDQFSHAIEGVAGRHASDLSQKADGLVEKMQQFTI